MTAAGASADSRMTYVKIIGEKEQAVESVGFDFLGLYRPGVILGNSNTPSYLERLMPLVHWAMPAKYRSIHKNDLACAMVAQSETAWRELAHGHGPAHPVVKRLEYPEMAPFFVVANRGA